jgi:Flp pilus assembly protein TadG
MGNEGNEMEMETVRGWIKKLSSFDHRRAQRLESPLLVAYYWDGSVPVGHEIRDISSSGFYLVTTERWHPGTVVTMTLQRSDIVHRDVNGDNYISVLSRVVRPGEDGVGFAFVPLETKGSRKKDVSPRSRPVGRKALYRFLEQLNLDQGHATIESNLGNGKEVLVGQDASLEMPGEKVMKTLRDESGQSLVLATFAMACLMGFVALAADVGMMFRERRLAQTAADSAAIAGAAELNFGDFSTAAQAAAAQNGFTNNANGATVTVNNPPLSGPHATGQTKLNYVEVIVSQSQPTFFMNVFGRSSMTVTGRAVATNSPSSSGCIYTLGTSGPGITGSGGASLADPGCGIIIDSDSARALDLSGGASLNVLSIGVVGHSHLSGGATTNPSPVTGIVAVSDPLTLLQQSAPSFNPTTLSCAAGVSVSGGRTQPLAPSGPVACYNGISASGGSTLNITNPGTIVVNGNLSLSGGSTANFGPGLYYITGQFSASGGDSTTGTGVTFFAAGPSGSFNLSGGVNMNLAAPLSGPDNGILFWQALGNGSPITMSGGANSVVQGIVYAPSAPLTMSGGAGAQLYLDAVVQSINLSGGASLRSFASVNSNSPITTTKLVE